MNRLSYNADKKQLLSEIRLVEKILAAARTKTSLGQAEELAMTLLKTQKTNTFSSIDINEYVAYMDDIFNDNGDANYLEATAEQLRIQILKDLEVAKNQ